MAVTPFGLDILDFRLHRFARMSWASDDAQNVWLPRIEEIKRVLHELEWRSVCSGIRSCGIVMAGPESVVDMAGVLASEGLAVWPLEIETTGSNPSYVLGAPFEYRMIVGSDEGLRCFHAAWSKSDHRALAQLLGYPACCADFLEAVKNNGVALHDTVWPMAVGGDRSWDGPRILEFPCIAQTNIMWRAVGVRCVFHPPCRFDCAASMHFGEQIMTLGQQLGFGDVMKSMSEILSWPVEWSCLHGIAEVKTPIMKMITDTDATASKFVVRLQGASFPTEGSSGLTFAYRNPPRLRITDSVPFRRGLDNPIRPLEPNNP